MIIQHGPGAAICLQQAQDVAAERSRWLADRGEIEPEPVPTLDELMAKVAELPARIVAIEAVWEGETEGWFVVLLAIIDHASRHHHRFDEVWLIPLRRGGDTGHSTIRCRRGPRPPRPLSLDRRWPRRSASRSTSSTRRHPMWTSPDGGPYLSHTASRRPPST